MSEDMDVDTLFRDTNITISDFGDILDQALSTESQPLLDRISTLESTYKELLIKIDTPQKQFVKKAKRSKRQ